MAPPIVSILTPSFNREVLIVETLDSVLRQTWPHWEAIVVDDGSTDRTPAVVAEYARRDSRVKLFRRTRVPKGACTCRNEGVARSLGKYVMFLDTDDVIEPYCLEQRVAAMEASPELDFGIFPSLMFEKIPHDLGLWWNVDKPEDELSRQFRQDAICQGTGVLWRKEAFQKIGMWDESLSLWQDFDLFFRAYIQGYRYAKFFDLPPDLHNRVTATSLSRENFFAREKTLSRTKVIRRAVALLKAHGMPERSCEARFMTAEIISAAARSKQPDIAIGVLVWAIRNRVLSTGQASLVAMLASFHITRLAGVRPFADLCQRVESRFITGTTLGKVPVRIEDWTIPTATGALASAFPQPSA